MSGLNVPRPNGQFTASFQYTGSSASRASFDFVSMAFTGASDYSGNPISGVLYSGATVEIEAATAPPPTDAFFRAPAALAIWSRYSQPPPSARYNVTMLVNSWRRIWTSKS